MTINQLRSYNFILTILLISWQLGACNSELRIIVPNTDIVAPTLTSTSTIPNISRKLIEGVYAVQQGKARFGDTVILKHDRESLSIFCQKNSTYMVLRSGMKDSSILYAGYWRNAQSPQTGLCTLEIRNKDGAKDLLQTIRPQTLTIRGAVGGSEVQPNEPLILEYVRPLFERKRERTDGKFWIIAHRGGGRNSDRLPFSENSTELIKFAGKLGANGVEIDIRLTKDGIPVLYHDENLNSRLVDGEYMVGAIGNYTFAQLQVLCRLKNGERIPTLDDALRTIVDSTNLTSVWLDIKEPAAIEKIIAMQKTYSERAQLLQAAGKRDTLEIFSGLATDEIYQAFVAHPEHLQIPSICELSISQTQKANSKVFAPRWTLGSLQSEVNSLHSENRRAFVWTLDQPEFIVQFLNEGNYDGILTNYPTVVAYNYYIRR